MFVRSSFTYYVLFTLTCVVACFYTCVDVSQQMHTHTLERKERRGKHFHFNCGCILDDLTEARSQSQLCLCCICTCVFVNVHVYMYMYVCMCMYMSVSVFALRCVALPWWNAPGDAVLETVQNFSAKGPKANRSIL